MWLAIHAKIAARKIENQFAGAALIVTINGEEKILDEGLRLTDLIVRLELKAERLAIEVNRQLIRRANWEATRLQDGDKIEIVHFVGGGALA
ncbi:MAG: sulfur carrier protein ThiS [Acidobacteria bacterium]|nr:sulfur carrier protein ThiS [Acidobacteriota bacterium]